MNRKSFFLSIFVPEKRLLTWVVSCIVLFLLPHLLLGQTSVTTDSTLTRDHVGNSSIDATDITLDCVGNSKIGPGTAIDVGGGIMRDIGIFLNGLTEVTIKNCHVHGFEVGVRLFQSHHNKLKKQKTLANTRNGFVLVDSNYNELKKNTARYNDLHGFVLVGSDENELEGNRAKHNGRNGFLIISGSENKLKENTARRNGGHDFLIFQSDGNYGFLVDGITNEGCNNGISDAQDDDSNTWHDNEFCDPGNI